MPLDPAVAALTGAGIGAVLAGASTWLIERARWHRQLSTRWDEKKLTIYAEFFVAMDDHRARVLEEDDRARALEKGDQDITNAKETRDHRKETRDYREVLREIQLLSSPDVYAAAARWIDAVNVLMFDLTLNPPAYFKNEEAVAQAREEFSKAARRELLGPTR